MKIFNYVVRVLLIVPFGLVVLAENGAYYVGEGADWIYRKSSILRVDFLNKVNKLFPI